MGQWKKGVEEYCANKMDEENDMEEKQSGSQKLDVRKTEEF